MGSPRRRRFTSWGASSAAVQGLPFLRVDDADRDAFLDRWDAEERVLPTQHFVQPVPTSPEKRLALAVLVQTLNDARGAGRNLGPHEDARTVRAEALAWLASDDTSHLYAFASLCDLFGWDVGALRAGILARLDAGTLRLPRMIEVTEPPAKSARPVSDRRRRGGRPRVMRDLDWQQLTGLFGADPDAYAAWRQRSSREFFEHLADERDAGRLVRLPREQAA